MIYHSTKCFNYNTATRTFSAEVSELTRGGNKQLFERIYDDACDEGFTMTSHTTGRTVVYALYEQHRNEDDDTLYWELKPTSESIRTVPSCKGTTVIIYND